MTDQLEQDIKQAFDAHCDADSAPLAESEGTGPSIEALVGAILSDKHTLSTEDLAVFDVLLNAPGVDPKQRQELLQTIWIIVVSIIDYQWDNASALSGSDYAPESCESNQRKADKLAQGPQTMIEYEDETLSETYSDAVGKGPSQEGGP